MIRPLRTRQRRMILLVGLVAGALIIAGLLVRRPVPKAESLPDRVLAATDGADR